MDARTAESLLDLAERTSPGLTGLDAKVLFDELDQHHGEFLTAMRWFLEHDRRDECIRFATALAPYWTATKRLAEGAVWFDRVLEEPGEEHADRGRAFVQAGFLAFWRGDDDRAAALYGKAVAIGRNLHEPTVTATALTGLARVALRTDLDTARRLCREALAVSEGTEDRLGRSSAIHVLGVAAQMSGDLLEARDWMSQRMAIAREMGSYAGISSEAGNLSIVERRLGNLDRAEALAREALEIDQRRADGWAIPYKLAGIAAVATERGDWVRAATLVGAAEALMEAQGAAWPPDEKPHYEHMLARLTEGMGAAEFERVRATGKAMPLPEAIEFALRLPATGARVP